MKKLLNLKIVNTLLFIDFLLLGLSGILYRFIPYEFYRIFHPAAGYLLILLVLLHLKLNWNWVKNQFFKKK